MKTKRKQREEDGTFIFATNARSEKAAEERRKGIDSEREAKAELAHRRASTPAPTEKKATITLTPREEDRGRGKDNNAHQRRGRSSGGGDDKRNVHNAGTGNNDSRRESSRTNSKVCRDYSRGDPRANTPIG